MASVDSVQRNHPGPLHTPSSEDELDKELDRLIDNGSDENDSGYQRKHPTSANSTDQRNYKKKNLRQMDTHYPHTPSPRSSSPGSPPPPTRQDHSHLQDNDEEDEDYGGPTSVENSKKVGMSNGDSMDDDDETYDNGLDYENMSEAQQQAMMELQNMKLDLAYTADEEPPEYDVTERVRQLNEELAKEPNPSESDRERAIKFPENPVSMVVPPADDYPESEEEENNTNNKETTVSENNKDSQGKKEENSLQSNKQNNMEEEVVEQEESVIPDNQNKEKDSPRDTKKESTKAEIGDEVVDSDDDITDKKDIRSRSSSDSDARSSDSSSNLDNKQGVSRSNRPKSSAPSRTRERHEQVNDSDNESNHSENKDNSTTQKHDTSNDDEKVLVERNGKFELLKASDLTVEERQIYGVETEEDKLISSRQEEKQDDDAEKAESIHSNASDSSSTKQHTPHPPARPKTATATSNRRAVSGKQRRATSAKQQSRNENDTDYDFNYTSPYALTPETRKELQREHNEKMKKQREEEKKKKNREDQDKEDADDAFKSWLATKRKDAAKRREEEDNMKKHEKEEQERNSECDDSSEHSRQRDPESAYKDWCSFKKQDQKRKKKEGEAQKREYESVHVTRPRNECNKAFREKNGSSKYSDEGEDSNTDLKLDLSPSDQAFILWLKKKNADLRRQKAEDKQKNRVYRLMSRKSRKSQQLARAMAHAQTFKYVDYYGYRF